MTDRREFIKQALIGGAGAALLAQLGEARAIDPFFSPQADRPWETLYPQILARIKAPTFPARDFDVTKFGAQGDGKFDCTDAFRKAIDACNRAGGGRVVVPVGQFSTGAIHLKSNVNLHVTKNATVK